MAVEVMVPRLGWSMESGAFGQWLKQDGDAVAVGEPVFTIEGEKATEEVESLDAGVLHIRPGVAEPGVDLTVGTVIGWLLAEGEEVPEAPPILPETRAPFRRRIRKRIPERRRRQMSRPPPLTRWRWRWPAVHGRTGGLPRAPGPDGSRATWASTGGWHPDPAREAASASAMCARSRHAGAPMAWRRQRLPRCPT